MSDRKPAIINRVVAKLVDLLIVITVASILPRFVGPLVGFLYSVLADGIQFGNFKGQSLGKKLLGLQVIRIQGDESRVRPVLQGHFQRHSQQHLKTLSFETRPSVWPPFLL